MSSKVRVREGGGEKDMCQVKKEVHQKMIDVDDAGEMNLEVDCKDVMQSMIVKVWTVCGQDNRRRVNVEERSSCTQCTSN